MHTNLVVNPFLQLIGSNEPDADYALIAPKPQSGLQQLNISKADQPNLHEVFLDLSQSRFDFLDLEKDINQTELELLHQYGVLVEVESVPDKVLFACFLDEVESVDFEEDISNLIVNPTFHYEPFDFSTFSTRVHGQHLSPHHPSVWIKQPLTEIDMGYWLTNEQAETIAKFTAGEKVSEKIESTFLSKLITSEILTTPEKLAENERKLREELEEAKTNYLKNRYVVLPKIMPPAQMQAMRRYYRQYVGSGFMPFTDPQSKRFYQHNEPLARVFHQSLTKLMCLIIGEEVIPSYVYAASYVEDAVLDPHTDREQCEFSISFQIDYLPEQDNHISPWGLFVWRPDDAEEEEALNYFSKEFPANSEAEDKNPVVYLASGDGIVYKGRELIHYRYALPKDHQSTSLFFHYVAADFQGHLS